jgi:hypothetical protein
MALDAGAHPEKTKQPEKSNTGVKGGGTRRHHTGLLDHF